MTINFIYYSISISGIIIVLAIIIIISSHCEGNYCCPCGVCDMSKGIPTDCNHCQCLGPDSEACHISGWVNTSPCCNENSYIEECEAYLG